MKRQRQRRSLGGSAVLHTKEMASYARQIDVDLRHALRAARIGDCKSARKALRDVYSGYGMWTDAAGHGDHDPDAHVRVQQSYDEARAVEQRIARKCGAEGV